MSERECEPYCADCCDPVKWIDKQIARSRAQWLWTAKSGLVHIGRNGWGNAYCGAKVGHHGRYTVDVGGRRNALEYGLVMKPCRRCATILYRARAAEDQMLKEYGFVALVWNTDKQPRKAL